MTDNELCGRLSGPALPGISLDWLSVYNSRLGFGAKSCFLDPMLEHQLSGLGHGGGGFLLIRVVGGESEKLADFVDHRFYS